MVPDVGGEPGLPVEALLLQTVDALRHDDPDRAEHALQCVLKDRPRHADAIHFLGVLRHQQGRADEALALPRQAIAAYQAALRLDPGSGQPWCNLGIVLMALWPRSFDVVACANTLCYFGACLTWRGLRARRCGKAAVSYSRLKRWSSGSATIGFGPLGDTPTHANILSGHFRPPDR